MKAHRKSKLLVVDDEKEVVDYLVEMLVDEGHEVTGTTSPREALTLVEKDDYDLVIADIEMPELRGLDLMAAIHEKRPEQLVLLITAFGSIDLAVSALRAGACDFITKPFRLEVLQVAVERVLRERQMRREIVRLRASLPDGVGGDLVIRSPAMHRVVDLASRAARTSATVLLTGESGVGKGAVAQFIHNHSDRAGHDFLQLNCAALPSTLVESELFGVRRGAFTDAREDRAGIFVKADGGTLLLDEIAEMPLEVQPKLLQVLESGKVRPVGETAEVKVDVRLLAATNRPLEEALQRQQFRPDLYYRLNVIRIGIPPLRERPEDLVPLIDVLIERVCKKVGKPVLGVSAEALRWMLSWKWPGNVRELTNVIERAVILSEHDAIVLEDVRLSTPNADGEDSFLDDAARQGKSLEDVENAYIQKILKTTDGNKTEAARILGIDRRTLYRKLGEEG